MKLDLNDAYYLAAGESLQLVEQWVNATSAWKQAVVDAINEIAPEAEGRFYGNGDRGTVQAIRLRTEPDMTIWRRVKGAWDAYLPRAASPLGKRWKELRKGAPTTPRFAELLSLNALEWRDSYVKGPGLEKVGGEYIISIPWGAMPGDTQPTPKDAVRLTSEQAANLLAEKEEAAA